VSGEEVETLTREQKGYHEGMSWEITFYNEKEAEIIEKWPVGIRATFYRIGLRSSDRGERSPSWDAPHASDGRRFV